MGHTSSGNEGPDSLPVDLELGVLSNVGENINSHLAQCQFNIVRVSREIYELEPKSLTSIPLSM